MNSSFHLGPLECGNEVHNNPYYFAISWKNARKWCVIKYVMIVWKKRYLSHRKKKKNTYAAPEWISSFAMPMPHAQQAVKNRNFLKMSEIIRTKKIKEDVRLTRIAAPAIDAFTINKWKCFRKVKCRPHTLHHISIVSPNTFTQFLIRCCPSTKKKKSEEWITKSSELEWKYSIEFITSASLSTPMVLIGSIRCFGGIYPCIDVNHTVRSYIEIQCTNNDESMRFSLSWAWAQNTSLSECPAVGPAARDSELS